MRRHSPVTTKYGVCGLRLQECPKSPIYAGFWGLALFAGFAAFSATAARMSAFSAFSLILSPSWISMARRTLPSRLELKRPARVVQRGALGEGQLHDGLVGLAGADDAGVLPHRHAAPLPFLDHVGAGLLDELRTRASVSPRQSPSSLIRPSISRDGELPPFASFAALVGFFMVVASWLRLRLALAGWRFENTRRRMCGLSHMHSPEEQQSREETQTAVGGRRNPGELPSERTINIGDDRKA